MSSDILQKNEDISETFKNHLQMQSNNKQIKNMEDTPETEIGPGASVNRKSFFRSPCALRNFSMVY